MFVQRRMPNSVAVIRQSIIISIYVQIRGLRKSSNIGNTGEWRQMAFAYFMYHWLASIFVHYVPMMALGMYTSYCCIWPGLLNCFMQCNLQQVVHYCILLYYIALCFRSAYLSYLSNVLYLFYICQMIVSEIN